MSLSLLAPALCLLLVSGMAVQRSGYLKPEGFEPYHARVREAVEAYPLVSFPWLGKDVADELPPSAVTLLRPNVIRSIRFTDVGAGYVESARARSVSLVIIHCKRTADMLGHYPPVCYRSLGWEEVRRERRTWELPTRPGTGEAGETLTVHGMEYLFARQTEDGDRRTLMTVLNFMAVAGAGTLPDMQGVQRAAADYQQRYFGAAQVQIVFNDDMTRQSDRAERDEIFRTLVTPAAEALGTIDGGLEPTDRHPAVVRSRRVDSGGVAHAVAHAGSDLGADRPM